MLTILLLGYVLAVLGAAAFVIARAPEGHEDQKRGFVYGPRVSRSSTDTPAGVRG